MRLSKQSWRVRLMSGGAACALALCAGAALAEDNAPISIAPQPLSSALYEFGAKTGRQVMFAPGSAATKTTRGVSPGLDEQSALRELLDGTGLTFRLVGDVYMIVQAGEGGSSPQDASAGDIDALIVTAQKKEEAIQDVPIAISAFTQKSLDAQKLEGGFDLLKAIPNVSFSKSNFSGYNFSIRGIGTKAVSATTDPGVAVSFNNTTLIVNRLFEQEYFDVERVEVLRGPQGTLYGRNATSGVINVLSARPRLREFEGNIKLEGGNYNARRARGMVNIPIGDTLAIRAAGALTKRDGYGTNEAAGGPDDFNGVSRDVDGRDLWSARLTVGWEPVDAVRVNALWERFEEDDNRVRTSKQLCHRDDFGPIGAFDWDTMTPTTGFAAAQAAIMKYYTSQSCQAGSLYEDAAYGTPNGASLPFISALFAAPLIGGGRLGIGLNPAWDDPAVAGPAPEVPRCNLEVVMPWLGPSDYCQPDPYGGRMQSRDLRTIHSLLEPIYRAKADVFELSVDVDITDSLTFTSQTVYVTDEYYATQDYNRFTTLPIWSDGTRACNSTIPDNPIQSYGPIPFFPGSIDGCADRGGFGGGYYAELLRDGVFVDPQLGPSRTLVAQDLSEVESEQFNQEIRLASNFDAPWNFSLGANFTHFETMNDYYVFINALSLATHFFPFNNPDIGQGSNGHPWCYFHTLDKAAFEPYGPCVYVDPNPLESIDGTGHNYFRSANPYKLTSSALFGEIYWQATDTVKVTAGARMTWDRKVFTPIPSQLLLTDYRRQIQPGAGPEACTNGEICPLAGTGRDDGLGARGSVPSPDIRQDWREPTGRIIVDWKPDLAFTDETMVYGSISHGYKGGGANPPNIAQPAGRYNETNSGVVSPPTFEPEFINAYEVGTKNTLLGGALILNGSAFYYDYDGYQVSKIVDRSASNENFDATVWGAELEWIFSPSRNLRFNGTFGALRTEISDGEQSIDLMNRTLDGKGVFTGKSGITYERWIIYKPWITNSSNCVVPERVLEAVLLAGSFGQQYWCLSTPLGTTLTADSPGFSIPGVGNYNPIVDAPNGSAGFFTDLSGHELPNAPHWTASLGAQYRMALPGGWDATLRGDFYWQSQSFARVYNTQYDKLRSWTNTNLSLWVENPDWGVTAEVYVKNVFDETPITDAFLNSDDSGLTTNVFTLDPRLVGVSIRKSF